MLNERVVGINHEKLAAETTEVKRMLTALMQKLIADS
jgi:hypothetical protein